MMISKLVSCAAALGWTSVAGLARPDGARGEYKLVASRSVFEEGALKFLPIIIMMIPDIIGITAQAGAIALSSS